MPRNLLLFTRNVARFAGEDSEPVIILVAKPATVARIVARVSFPVRSAVNILSAGHAAMRHVPHVSNHVHGRASTKALVLCHALLPATDYRAIGVVLENYHVATSARDSAARRALNSAASNVE